MWVVLIFTINKLSATIHESRPENGLGSEYYIFEIWQLLMPGHCTLMKKRQSVFQRIK